MLKVVNKRNHKATAGQCDFYIGRPGVLGNTFIIGKDGNREQVIAKYRVWLWKEMKKHSEVWDEICRLEKLEKAFGIVNLVCFCAPEPCHGDVIAKAVEWKKTTSRKTLRFRSPSSARGRVFRGKSFPYFLTADDYKAPIFVGSRLADGTPLMYSHSTGISGYRYDPR